MHRDLNDFELLYLVKNNCLMSIIVMLEKYNPLVWKHVFKCKNLYMPRGVETEDLYQEGRIALFDSMFSYKTFINVPFYSFTKLCIERKMGGYIRKFNSETTKLFYSALSFDMTVTEDKNVYLHEMVAEDITKISAFTKFAKELTCLALDESLLSKFEKNILLLKIYGYTYAEMGQMLECSSKKVDNTLQKVKRLLS